MSKREFIRIRLEDWWADHSVTVRNVGMIAVTVVAVWLRYLGALQTYLALLDYGLTPLLYVNAFWMLWALLRQSRPK